MTEDDKAFWSYVLEEDRPSTMAGVQESEGEDDEEVEDEGDDGTISEEEELYDNDD